MQTLLWSLFFATATAAAPGARLELASPEPHTMIVVDDARVAVHDTAPGADRPVVFCLHAVGHGGGDYAAVLEALAATHRVIVIDWPGHGASDDDRSPASAAHYAKVFERVVDELDVDRFTIIGNSIGGAVAIQYGFDHPDRVQALVLVDAGGLDPGGVIARWYVGGVARRFERGAEGQRSFPAWYRRYYGRILRTPAADPRRELIVAAGPQMARVLGQAWRSFAEPQADLRGLLPSLTMPVLVAWANQDKVIRWSRNEPAIRLIPNARVARFKGGHSAFIEDAEAFSAALNEFLSGLEARQLSP